MTIPRVDVDDMPAPRRTPRRPPRTLTPAVLRSLAWAALAAALACPLPERSLATPPLVEPLRGRVAAVPIPVAEAERATGDRPWKKWERYPSAGDGWSAGDHWSALAFSLPPGCSSGGGCYSPPSYYVGAPFRSSERCGIGPFEWRREWMSDASQPETLQGPIVCRGGLEHRLSTRGDVVQYRCPARGAAGPVEAAFRLIPAEEALPVSPAWLLSAGTAGAFDTARRVGAWSALALLVAAGLASWSATRRGGAGDPRRWRLTVALALASMTVTGATREVLPRVVRHGSLAISPMPAQSCAADQPARASVVTPFATPFVDKSEPVVPSPPVPVDELE